MPADSTQYLDPVLDIKADSLPRTIANAIATVDGYARTFVPTGSFADYLRHLPLQPEGSQVRYYDGSVKTSDNVCCAVIDLDVGAHNLHQFADAIIRLKAEYHWRRKEYEQIHFNSTQIMYWVFAAKAGRPMKMGTPP